MHDDRQRILDLLAAGDINAEEAARLLDCLKDTPGAPAPGLATPRATAPAVSSDDAKRMGGKKLRVEVKGDTEDTKKLNVNVSIPLVLARYADNIIANCVPKDVDIELKSKGIDLSSLKIGEIIDTFETLEEDIVNADIKQEDVDLKVRVYVE